MEGLGDDTLSWIHQPVPKGKLQDTLKPSQRAEDTAQSAETLPSMYGIWGSVPTTEKHTLGRYVMSQRH